MTFLEALQEARPLIESSRETYICEALWVVGAVQYRHKLLGQLQPFTTYDAWLCMYHPERYEAALRRGVVQPFRLGRLAWIDDMIAKEKANVFNP